MIIVNNDKVVINQKELIAMDKDSEGDNINFYFNNMVKMTVKYDSIEQRNQWYARIVKYLAETLPM